MAILFDDVISGEGSAHLGDPATINYVLWEVQATGIYVRSAEQWDSQRKLRVGYFQFSYEGSDFGDTLAFWDAPRWLDNLTGRWLPGALIPPATTFRWYAQSVRWALSPGCEVRLQVND